MLVSGEVARTMIRCMRRALEVHVGDRPPVGPEEGLRKRGRVEHGCQGVAALGDGETGERRPRRPLRWMPSSVRVGRVRRMTVPVTASRRGSSAAPASAAAPNATPTAAAKAATRTASRPDLVTCPSTTAAAIAVSVERVTADEAIRPLSRSTSTAATPRRRRPRRTAARQCSRSSPRRCRSSRTRRSASAPRTRWEYLLR